MLKIEEKLIATLKTPPAKVQAWVEGMDENEKESTRRLLESSIQHYAWVAGYIRTRQVGIGSDRGHEQAVRRGNRFLAAVRKMLGYAYPAAGNLNV